MRNIHCLNNISAYGTDLLTDDYQLVDDLTQAEGVLVRSAALHDTAFPESLQAIARAGAGVNNIPLDRCAEEGIVVFNTPGANANAVKEIVVCGLMLGSRDIAGGIAWCRHNAADENIAKAAEKAKKAFAGREVKGKKLGVIGLGAIGAEVANIAIDLGMDVYGYDPYVSVGAAWRISSAVHHVTNLDDIFRTCDYMTIHVPAMEGTIGTIDERACSLMKDGAVFLNFSRDTLVDNAAMAAALDSGKVHAYITDFATPEVMKMERAIVLPHLGASTPESEENCAVMAARQLQDYLVNGNITNSVNLPNVSQEWSGIARLCLIHKNVPAMLTQIMSTLSDDRINVENMTNKSRQDYAYTIVDVNTRLTDEVADELRAIPNMIRVRVLNH